MHITLTNLGDIAVPFSSTQDKGFATLIAPDEHHALDSADVTVASVGDNPTASEEFVEGIKNLFEELGNLITFWRDHSKDAGSEPPLIVTVQIENRGVNALRVLLGSNINEVEVGAGETYTATAAEWVEIRELGV